MSKLLASKERQQLDVGLSDILETRIIPSFCRSERCRCNSDLSTYFTEIHRDGLDPDTDNIFSLVQKTAPEFAK
jgi:hypothetical protein